MEPDHRLFLMESWKALEDAGYGSSELNGKRCAVFAGCVGDNYIDVLRAANRDKEAFSFIGTSPAILSARIAYHLNLKGPSLTLDTACSSTGVAIHLACESLQLRTSDMALAGGVSIMNTPQLYIWLSQTGMLSPEGKCKTFGDDADGFVPGEAVVVLVLKRLADATRDGDHVYGIIRGSGVNQDGKTNGITAPSGPSQTALETEVYHRYSIDPGTISYVECHGTGTKLGDPIEVEALTKAFRQFTHQTGFCRIGSVKTNIGHTLLASAGAGVVKVLLALQRKQLPPSLHATTLNGHIAFAESPFYVNRELTDWQAPSGQPLRAAVSSFGFSGTNVHIVIEESPPPTKAASVSKPAYLATLSARSEKALKTRIKELAAWLSERERDNVELTDICYTLNVGRSHFEKRQTIIIASVSELRATLESLAAGQLPGNAMFETVKSIAPSDAAIYRQVQRSVLAELAPSTNVADYRDKLQVLARLYVKGYEIDWKILHHGESCGRLSLPSYPFDLERYWFDPPSRSPGNPVPTLRLLTEATSFTADQVNRRVCIEPVWRPASLQNARPELLSGSVLVIDDEALSRELERRLSDLKLWRLQESEECKVIGQLALAPVRSDSDYAELLATLAPYTIVYHCRSVSTASDQMALGIETVYSLCKNLVRSRRANDVRFLLVDGPDVPPEISAISAFLETVAQENPRIRTLSILTDDPAGSLLEEIQRFDGAREVRYRNGVRERKTLRELELPKAESSWFRPEGVYIIAGGAGGLGRIFSEHLIRRYNARLAWVGRSELTANQVDDLERLIALGGEIIPIRADLSVPSQVNDVIGQVKGRFGKINGVIHAAGVVRNNFVLNKSRAELNEVITSKLQVAVNLDQALADEPLDGFLLCSSIASLLPEPGQSDYAFANRFLDDFSAHREELRRQGKRKGRTLSINWQMWQRATIVKNVSLEELTSRAQEAARLTGLPFLTNEQGLDLLEQSVGVFGPAALIGVGQSDQLLRRTAQLYDEQPAEQPVQPAAWDQGALVIYTKGYVKQLLSDLLKIPAERFDTDASLVDYGLDSILITTFNRTIEKVLPTVPKTLLFEYPNSASVSEYLLTHHRSELFRLFEEAPGQTTLKSASEAQPSSAVSGTGPERISEPVERQQSVRDIAIIGMTGRFPQADELREFWVNLRDGRNSITELPHRRWITVAGGEEISADLTELSCN